MFHAMIMDKFSKSFYKANFEEKQNMNALALSMVILSFGVPFIQAGSEFLRSKFGEHNSYNSHNSINKINWEYKKNHKHVFDYIKKLIEFRKSQRVFSITKKEEIKMVTNIIKSEKHIIMYELNSSYDEDYKKILIIYNGSFEDKIIKLEDSNYKIIIDGALYYGKSSNINGGVLLIPKLSGVVCVI